jgi:hypothetical protein
MKILALEKEIAGVSSEQFQQWLKPEARKVWEFYLSGKVREMYFRQDQHMAVLVLECSGVQEANEILHSLPLVSAGLISFEVIPLEPYPGLARLFEEGGKI